MDLPTFKNPIYTRLKEHVLFENEISKKRKDLESQYFTLLADFSFNQHVIQNQIQDILKEKNYKDCSSLSDIKEFSLLIKLSSIHNVPIENNVFESFEYLLNELVSSKTYPVVAKSTISWILKDVQAFEPLLLKLQEQLDQNCIKYLSKYEYKEGIELAFGSNNDSAIDKIISNPIQFTKHAQNWPRDKIAKAIIRLNSVEGFSLSELVKILESKIDQEFSSWVEPDIWLAIIESEKIVNSNISQSEIDSVLNNLKNAKDSWAKIIESIDKEGVHIRLNNVMKRPTFSPFEDTLSLLALKCQDREYTIQISKKRYEDLILFENKIDSIPLLRSEIILYASCIFLLATIETYLAHLIITSYESFSSFINAISKYDPSNTVAILFDVIGNPFLAFGFFLWWLIRLIKYPIDKKAFNWKSIFISCPLWFLFKKIFKND